MVQGPEKVVNEIVLTVRPSKKVMVRLEDAPASFWGSQIFTGELLNFQGVSSIIITYIPQKLRQSLVGDQGLWCPIFLLFVCR